MTDADATRHEEEALRRAMERVRGQAQQPAAADAAAVEQPMRGLRARVRADLSRVPTPDAAAWPPAVAGLVAGAWSALMSWLVVAGVLVACWVFAPLGGGDFADVARASGALWLVADGGEVHWQGSVLSLPPLALTFIIVLLQRRAGAWLANAVVATRPRDCLLPMGFAVVSALSMQALVAASVMDEALSVAMGRSLVGAALVALIGFGWGIGREVGLAVPAASHGTFAAMRTFVVGIGALSCLLIVIAAIGQRSAFLEVLDAVAGDTTSRAQVLLLCLAYLPTMCLWAVALILGPGFSVGAGTGVAWGHVVLGALPPVPLLALVPEHLPQVLSVSLLVPALLAWWSTRPIAGALSRRIVLELVVASIVVGWLVSVAAGGGIGPGRLASVGTAWWAGPVSVLAWMALGVVVHVASAWVVQRLRTSREAGEDPAGRLAP